MLVARRMRSSQANGPGNRAVVWLQGCDARCPGCCNPELQPLESPTAEDTTPIALAMWFTNSLYSDPTLRGLTLSGGEPLHPRHKDDVLLFMQYCRHLASRSFDAMAFTGYTPEQVIENFGMGMLNFDLLIAGPYDEARRNATGIVSSTNQMILRNSLAFADVDDDTLLNGGRIIEVRMADGSVTVTGLSSVTEALEILGMDDDPRTPLSSGATIPSGD